MPGIFGFVGVEDREMGTALLEGMSQAIMDHEGYKVGTFYEEGVGVGRAGLGLFDPAIQPVWNAEKSMCIVMEGELYGYQSLKAGLIDRGFPFKENNDAEFMLYLYEEYGLDLAPQLNGAYAAAIWDCRERKLVLINDRFGLRPLYYAAYARRFTFGSGVRALLADSALPRRVDVLGIAQALTFEHLLDDRTLLSEVRLLPPASTLTLQEGQISVRTYWNFKYQDTYAFRKEQDYLEGLIFFLRQAASRQLPIDGRKGLNLSGGLDSRMLLGLLTHCEPKGDLRTFTFGVPECDDARLARKLASIEGTAHQFYELKPDYLLETATTGVRLTDGMMSVCHMQALANAGAQAKQVDIIYGGYLIDSLISSDLHRDLFVNYDDETVLRVILDRSTFMFRNKNTSDLFTEDVRHLVDSSFLEVYRSAALDARSYFFADWLGQFEVRQRARRFAENGNEVLRGELICRTPFCDNDLVDFILTLPPGLRMDRILFIEALARMFHDLAKVPWEKTGYPLVPCAREAALRVDSLARWHLRKLGLSWIKPQRVPRPYTAYPVWMRTSLREWIEDLLLSRRAEKRGYFNPSFTRELVSSHMAGENHSRELGMLLSLELWHRQFLD